MSKQSLQDTVNLSDKKLSRSGRKSHKKLKPHKGSTVTLRDHDRSNTLLSTQKKQLTVKQPDDMDEQGIDNMSEVEKVSDDMDDAGSQNEVQEAPKISATVKTKKSNKPKDVDSMPAQSITDPLEEMTEQLVAPQMEYKQIRTLNIGQNNLEVNQVPAEILKGNKVDPKEVVQSRRKSPGPGEYESAIQAINVKPKLLAGSFDSKTERFKSSPFDLSQRTPAVVGPGSYSDYQT